MPRTLCRFILLALCCFHLVACTAVRQQLGHSLVSLETEVALGEKIAAQTEEQEKVLQNPRIQAYIRQLAQPLISQGLLDRPEITYRITVLDNAKQINAFAIPGGHIYVYTGLLLAAENEAEVAGVLAHEIGHVVARHSANQLASQVGLQLLTEVALGQESEELAAEIAAWANTGAMARFSRDDERQADSYAVKYLTASGYEPRGLITFFAKMRQLEAGKRSELENLLASHPPTDERMQRLEKLIAKAGDPGGKTNAPHYRTQLRSLKR